MMELPKREVSTAGQGGVQERPALAGAVRGCARGFSRRVSLLGRALPGG